MNIIHWISDLFLNIFFPSTTALLFVTYIPIAYIWNYLWSFVPGRSPEDKIVLITGASSGIGEHVAYEYSKRKVRLALVARREDRLQMVADNCKKLGAKSVKLFIGDMTVEADCQKAVQFTIDAYNQLNILVCNAGVAEAYYFEDVQDFAALDYPMKLNFWGYVWTTKYALPHLRQTSGQIIANASVASFSPMPRLTIYNASKAAVVQFFDTLRNEPVGKKVKITIVMPGWIQSEMTTGKFITEEVKTVVDTERRDELVGPQPILETKECARSIVKAACKGMPYLIVPSRWFSIAVLRLFAPRLTSFLLRIVYRGEKWQPAPSKKILDTMGVKNSLFPSRTAEEQHGIKTGVKND